MSNLSRQYRPHTFADISGQSQVVETLRREVEQSKLGHAYLFSGPRGVGKTTAARIFAKAINCSDPQKGEPCLKCVSCKRIAEGQAIDLIEIDAASHRGVAEVQESIIDHIKYVPANLKYKVYILDEAHMLTPHAWNALLKTVEEPPEYAIFIFATTERHKVPATIISRCQRFEFSRIDQQEIIARLKMLADKEKAKVDDEVLATIATKTEGCLRDAENLLGQLFSLGEKKITPQVASIVIPPSQTPFAVELLQSALNHDVETILAKIDELEAQGASFIPLFDDLITSARDLLIATNVQKHKEQLEQGTEADKKLVSLIGKADTAQLVQTSHILMERRREAKHGIDPRFALELGLVAITTLEQSQIPLNPPLPRGTPSDSPSLRKEGYGVDFSQQKQTNKIKDEGIKIKDEPLKTAAVKSLEVFDEPPADDSKSRVQNSEFGVRVEDVQRIWPKFLQEFEDQKSLLFILKPCQVVNVKNNCVSLKLEFAYHKKSLEQAQNKAIIENKMAKLLGLEKISIIAVMDEVVADEPAHTPVKDTANKIIDVFGGELM
ncbi:DNA polymerase III subunit gamma/tau [Candidatus Uhrbacteria bacterium]|nr:DNA polymerase III subunit gamma/tau [Candidatus Uhrbacteria bacterium]